MLQCWGLQFSLPPCCSSCFHCSNSTPINTTDVLLLVSLYFVFKVQDFLTLISPPLLPCSPMGSLPAAFPFLSPPEKEKQFLPVLQTPAFPMKQELRCFEIFISALLLCSQVMQNKRKLLSLWFVFWKGIWILWHKAITFSKKQNPNKVILEE